MLLLGLFYTSFASFAHLLVLCADHCVLLDDIGWGSVDCSLVMAVEVAAAEVWTTVLASVLH